MRLPRLSITYLLEDTALFGGVKVVFHQANLMVGRGHRVTVVSKGGRPDWYQVHADLLQIADFRSATLPLSDLSVATFWTTIEAAANAGGQAVHFCQGFEGSLTHNRSEHDAIRAAYSICLPAMTVAPHLREILRTFHRPARVVPPPVEPFWSAAWRLRPRRRPRILVTSPFEADIKGVATALRAIAELRRSGIACDVVRISAWPLCSEERLLLEPDEFHCHLSPQAAARVVRTCDLHLAPSWEQEGFGLPVLESMACGVPVIASDISCFRFFARGAATLVAFDDPVAFAQAAQQTLSDKALWKHMRHSGLTIARQFREEAGADAAEEALYWVASGAWKSET